MWLPWRLRRALASCSASLLLWMLWLLVVVGAIILPLYLGINYLAGLSQSCTTHVSVDLHQDMLNNIDINSILKSFTGPSVDQTKGAERSDLGNVTEAEVKSSASNEDTTKGTEISKTEMFLMDMLVSLLPPSVPIKVNSRSVDPLKAFESISNNETLASPAAVTDPEHDVAVHNEDLDADGATVMVERFPLSMYRHGAGLAYRLLLSRYRLTDVTSLCNVGRGDAGSTTTTIKSPVPTALDASSRPRFISAALNLCSAGLNRLNPEVTRQLTDWLDNLAPGLEARLVEAGLNYLETEDMGPIVRLLPEMFPSAGLNNSHAEAIISVLEPFTLSDLLRLGEAAAASGLNEKDLEVLMAVFTDSGDEDGLAKLKSVLGKIKVENLPGINENLGKLGLSLAEFISNPGVIFQFISDPEKSAILGKVQALLPKFKATDIEAFLVFSKKLGELQESVGDSEGEPIMGKLFKIPMDVLIGALQKFDLSGEKGELTLQAVGLLMADVRVQDLVGAAFQLVDQLGDSEALQDLLQSCMEPGVRISCIDQKDETCEWRVKMLGVVTLVPLLIPGFLYTLSVLFYYRGPPPKHQSAGCIGAIIKRPASLIGRLLVSPLYFIIMIPWTLCLIVYRQSLVVWRVWSEWRGEADPLDTDSNIVHSAAYSGLLLGAGHGIPYLAVQVVLLVMIMAGGDVVFGLDKEYFASTTLGVTIASMIAVAIILAVSHLASQESGRLSVDLSTPGEPNIYLTSSLAWMTLSSLISVASFVALLVLVFVDTMGFTEWQWCAVSLLILLPMPVVQLLLYTALAIAQKRGAASLDDPGLLSRLDSAVSGAVASSVGSTNYATSTATSAGGDPFASAMTAPGPDPLHLAWSCLSALTPVPLVFQRRRLRSALYLIFGQVYWFSSHLTAWIVYASFVYVTPPDVPYIGGPDSSESGSSVVWRVWMPIVLILLLLTPMATLYHWVTYLAEFYTEMSAHPDMRHYTDRKRSFPPDWAKIACGGRMEAGEAPDPSSLAAAGFFYSCKRLQTSETTCYSCGKQVSDWAGLKQQGGDLSQLHAAVSSYSGYNASCLFYDRQRTDKLQMSTDSPGSDKASAPCLPEFLFLMMTTAPRLISLALFIWVFSESFVHLHTVLPNMVIIPVAFLLFSLAANTCLYYIFYPATACSSRLTRALWSSCSPYLLYCPNRILPVHHIMLNLLLNLLLHVGLWTAMFGTSEAVARLSWPRLEAIWPVLLTMAILACLAPLTYIWGVFWRSSDDSRLKGAEPQQHSLYHNSGMSGINSKQDNGHNKFQDSTAL